VCNLAEDSDLAAAGERCSVQEASTPIDSDEVVPGERDAKHVTDLTHFAAL